MNTMREVMSREEFRKTHKKMNLETQRERTSLESISHLIDQWRAFVRTSKPSLMFLIEDVERTIEVIAIGCWGPQTQVQFDRDFESITVSNPDGRVLEL